jgi:predicted dehydrogenase
VRFENGALGTIEATTAAYPGFPERIDIIGEAGSASLLGTELKVAWKDGRTSEFGTHATGGGAGADPMDFPHDYHRDLLADFLDAIAADREPTVNGEEALKVHRLIDALLESGATGRRVRLGS